MQKPVLAAGIALFAIVIAGILVLQSSKNPPKKESKLLKVYFTCDTRGRLEPCGCFTGQMGGLTRAHTWLLRNGEANSLRVDVGGAIGGDQDYHVIQYRYLQKAYQRMGYHALNLGAAEAQLSANTLRELISEAQLPLLSASLVDISSRKPIAQPTAKIKIQGRTIGLLGVVDPRSVNAPGEGVAILSLNDAISRHLPALHAECDEVVLLCFAKEAEMERIANQFYEFALIVGGDVGQPSQKAEVFNDTLIVFTTNQARTVGEISFRRRNDSLEVEAYDIHRLYADVAQSEELTSLSKEFRTFIKTATLDIDNPNRTNEGSIPGVKPLASFVGSQSCVQCHVNLLPLLLFRLNYNPLKLNIIAIFSLTTLVFWPILFKQKFIDIKNSLGLSLKKFPKDTIIGMFSYLASIIPLLIVLSIYSLILINLGINAEQGAHPVCLLYTSPSPRDQRGSRMPSSA